MHDGRVGTVDVDQLATVVGALPGEPRVVASGNFATPVTALAALDEGTAAYRLFVLNAQHGVPAREGVTPETCFVGPGMRGADGLRYVPSRLSMAPLLFGSALPPDVLVLHTSTPSEGTVSMGTEVNVLPAALDAVKARGGLVVAQMNPRMPYTFGDGVLPLDVVDYAVEVDEPLASPAPPPLDETSREIGARVASLVPDGATLQLGIGAVPDATLAGLTERRGLRVWTEMFSDGVLALDGAGALDPDAVLTASFLFGSETLYRWVHRNPRVRVLRTEKTNAPALIAQQPALTSVNTALQVDLFGQANASRIKGRIYSGFGGQTDFTIGALHSPGGQALMTLRSWHPRADCSTIVPLVDEPVTSFQHSAVVTDQGVARIFGRDERSQARALIDEAAHPSVRDELDEEGRALGIL
jgi:acyl-CoA hydrolase